MKGFDDLLIDTVLADTAKSFADQPDVSSRSLVCDLQGDSAVDQLLDSIAVQRDLRGPDRRIVTGDLPGARVVVDLRAAVARITIVGGDQKVLDRLAHELQRRVMSPDPRCLALRRWRAADHQHIERSSAQVPRTSWADIARNYPARVAAGVERLIRLDLGSRSGWLVVFYGPPGTGKTTAVRALLGAWTSSAQLNEVVEADDIFHRRRHLETILGADAGHRSSDESPRLRVVVAEDCSDILRSDRWDSSAQTNLLQIADGLARSESPAMLVITTNLTQGDINPAMLRPGRCHTALEFDYFSYEEARTWLGDPSASFPDGRPTLAELYWRAGHLDHHHTGATRTGIHERSYL
jgi:hypothetical protein